MALRKRGVSLPSKAQPVESDDVFRGRRKSGISLEEIAAKTKISKRFLVAIEAADFAQLPGGVFNVNYLRQYAEAAGVDAEALLALYRAKTEPAQPDLETSKARGFELRTLLDRVFGLPVQPVTNNSKG